MSDDEKVDEIEENQEEKQQESKLILDFWEIVKTNKVPKIIEYIKTHEEEQKEILQSKHAETGKNILQYSIDTPLGSMFELVQYLLSFGRDVFDLKTNPTELEIYDKFIEKRKEEEEKRREEEEKRRKREAGELDEEEEEEEEEQQDDEPPKDFATILSEEHENISIYKIREIGDVGIYDGGKDENGKRSGFGICLFPNEEIYIGNYADNKRNGRGAYKYKNGSLYVGEWKAGKKHGKGILLFPDKGRYIGMFSRNMRCGQGTYMYPNGDQYIGNWENDLKHGKGLYYFSENGSKYQGMWKKGKFIEGIWKMKNDVVYHGEFKNEKPCGKGTLYFPNNLVQEGYYDDQQKWTTTKTYETHYKSQIQNITSTLYKEEKEGKPKGTLVLVVGMSGSGKDTLINGAKKQFDKGIHFVKRVITKQSDENEEFESVTKDEFEKRKTSGEIGLFWEWNTELYGIMESHVVENLDQGIHVVANVSRNVIKEAEERYAKYPILVIDVTVDENIIKERLTNIGKNEQQIVELLKEEPKKKQIVEIFASNAVNVTNNTTVDEGIQQFTNILKNELNIA